MPSKNEVLVCLSHVLDAGYRLELCDEPYPAAPACVWRRRAYAVENLYGWAVVTTERRRIRQRQVADKAEARRVLAEIGGVR